MLRREEPFKPPAGSPVRSPSGRAKLERREVPTSSGCPRTAGRRRIFLDGPGRVGVGELEVRGHLPEIPQHVLRHGALQDREDGAERLDCEPRLLEIAVVRRELAVAERRTMCR